MAGSDWSSDLDQIIALADAARLAPPDPAVAASLSALVERLHGYVSAHVLAGLIEQLQETVTALVTIIDQISGLAEARAAIEPFDEAFAELPREVPRDVHAKATEKAAEARRSLAAALAQLEEVEQAQASSLPLKQKHARSAALLDAADTHARFGLEAAHTAVMIVARAKAQSDAPADPFQVLVTYDTPALVPVPEAAHLEASDVLTASSVSGSENREWAENPTSECILHEGGISGDGALAPLSVTQGLEMSQPEDALRQADTKPSAVVEQPPALLSLISDAADAACVGEHSSMLSFHDAAGSQVKDLADEELGGEEAEQKAEVQVPALSTPISPPQDDYSLAEQRLADLRKQFRTKQHARASFTLAKYARTCLF
ncbi:hypothetical protein [Microvirga arabica]|uniref:hypothetical protein n=1 Tax=Microvirga arabica TaxID=1128671 RepID=UPI00193A34CF